MGVVLVPTRTADTQGVVLSRVFPNSPAEKSGLRAGDIVTKVDGQQVTGIETLLKCLEHHAPGAGCDLVVIRDGEQQNVQLNLGDLTEAPEDWLAAAFRAPMDLLDSDADATGSADEDLRIRVQELQREVAELRARLDALDRRERGTSAEGAESSERSTLPSGQGDGEGDSPDLSRRTGGALSAPWVTLPAATIGLVSVQERGGDGRRRSYNRNWNRYGSGTYYRYGYPYYRQGYYPYYGTWYYPYGNNRWYHQGYTYGGYYYGPRFGIRIGPVWGAYWY
jgi:hypothetical protein